MTQVADVEAVITAAKQWDFVDPDKIVLLGGSQGGYVSAVAAARYANEIAELFLVCPAFVA